MGCGWNIERMNSMTHRERFHKLMHFEPYDRIPIVHFGFWNETVINWMNEGHISKEECKPYATDQFVFDGSSEETCIARKLGFDYNYFNVAWTNFSLFPAFEKKILETTYDGFEKILTEQGVIELHRGNAKGIPARSGHLLTNRASWEEHFKHRLQPSTLRCEMAIAIMKANEGQDEVDRIPLGLHCGSLFGVIRDIMGIEGISYLYADDEKLFNEIIETVAEISYQNTKNLLETGFRFDFAHFWEDICFKNGPLVAPQIFKQYVGPHYCRITNLIGQYDIDIISVDCDGMIDLLIPIWLDNGVNTMFPIEVGTWGANISPWRAQYGKKLLGVGGVNKVVFSRDYESIDHEIERLKPLVELGGYLPCIDHRIPPDAKWENIQYYCDRMHKIFG